MSPGSDSGAKIASLFFYGGEVGVGREESMEFGKVFSDVQRNGFCLPFVKMRS